MRHYETDVFLYDKNCEDFLFQMPPELKHEVQIPIALSQSGNSKS